MPNLNLQPVVQRSMPLSMATEADLRFTAQQALEVIDRNVPGVFVECGVWRGGCSAAMLLAQRERHGTVMRKTYLLRIALLRLDGDWYHSTAVCLEHLVPIVPEGGVVILDDYYVFDGCARATHDFLSRHDVPYRICPVPGGVGAYFVKRAASPAGEG
jgi:hypothetical protein